MALGGSKKPPQDIPGETIPRENPRLTFEETSSLLLPEKERRYHSSRKQMKTKYYELEACREQICNEVQKNLSSTLSCELEVMSSVGLSYIQTLRGYLVMGIPYMVVSLFVYLYMFVMSCTQYKHEAQSLVVHSWFQHPENPTQTRHGLLPFTTATRFMKL